LYVVFDSRGFIFLESLLNQGCALKHFNGAFVAVIRKVI